MIEDGDASMDVQTEDCKGYVPPSLCRDEGLGSADLFVDVDDLGDGTVRLIVVCHTCQKGHEIILKDDEDDSEDRRSTEGTYAKRRRVSLGFPGGHASSVPTFPNGSNLDGPRR